MNIHVLSRRDAEALLPGRRAIISITAPHARLARLEHTGPLLRTVFSDAVPVNGVPTMRHLPASTHKGIARADYAREVREIRLFTRAQALEIVDFVCEHAWCMPLVIHCLGGISRSAAVAQAINHHYASANVHYGKFVDPNPYVYEIMRETLAVRRAA